MRYIPVYIDGKPGSIKGWGSVDPGGVGAIIEGFGGCRPERGD